MYQLFTGSESLQNEVYERYGYGEWEYVVWVQGMGVYGVWEVEVCSQVN